MGVGKGFNPNSLKNLNMIKPGEVRNPGGKAKGVKDKITRIKEAFCDAFNPKDFQEWANSHKSEFYPLIVKIMPKEMEIKPGEGGFIIQLVSFSKPEDKK